MSFDTARKADAGVACSHVLPIHKEGDQEKMRTDFPSLGADLSAAISGTRDLPAVCLEASAAPRDSPGLVAGDVRTCQAATHC